MSDVQKTPIQHIYEGLAAKNPDLKEYGFDAFANDMKDENNLKSLYSGLAEKNPTLKETGFDSFKSDIWGEQPDTQKEQNTDPIASLHSSIPYVYVDGDNQDNNQIVQSLPESKQDVSYNENNLPKIGQEGFVDNVIPQQKSQQEQYFDQAQQNTGGARINSDQQEKSLFFSSPEEEKIDLAQNIIDRSKRQINAVTGQGDNTGVGDALRDRNFWTLGASDLSSMIYLKKIAGKLEDGTPLTEGDKALLEAWNQSEQVNQQYPSSDANIWYKTGKNVTDMIPWLVQFAATRGTGSTVTKGIQSTLKQNAEKYLGSTITKGLSKGIAEVAGAYAAAAFMPNTYADITRRTLGQTYQDKQGDIKFDISEADSNAKAIYKGWTSGMLEVLTERLGEGITEGIKYLPKNKFTSLLTSEAKGKTGKAISDFTKAVGWNGAPLEYLEEWVNVPLNALLVGDNKYSDMFDGKQQLETLLTVAAMGTAIGSTQYAANKYDSYRSSKNYKSAKSLFDNEIDDETRNMVESIINSNQSISEISDKLDQIFTNVNGEKAGIIMNYVVNSMKNNNSQQPTGPVSSDSNPQFTISPRQQAEFDLRSTASQFANNETGLLQTIQEATPDGQENRIWFIKAGQTTDPDGSILVEDEAGNSKFLTKEQIAGEPNNMTIDDFVTKGLDIFDLKNQNKMNYNGRVLRRSQDPDVHKTEDGEFWFDDHTDQAIEVPLDVINKWNQKDKAFKNIETTFGKMIVTGTRNEDGSITLINPLQIYALEELKANVEKEPNGEYEVLANPIPNKDFTMPVQYAITIRKKNNVQKTKNERTGTEHKVIKQKPEPYNPQKQVQLGSTPPRQDNNVSTKQQVQPEQPKYTLNGNEIDQTTAKARVRAAILKGSADKLAGLEISNDPELSGMIEKAFPKPKAKFTLGNKTISPEDAMDWIIAADNFNELNELKAENIDSEPAVAEAFKAKVKYFTPTQQIIENEKPIEQPILKQDNPNTSPKAEAIIKEQPTDRAERIVSQVQGKLFNSFIYDYFLYLNSKLSEFETIHIVESYDEIPIEFRQAAIQNKAFGFFNQRSGETYFITSNIKSIDDAIKTWIHEIGIHKGIRNIIPGSALRSLFEKVVDDIGDFEINKVLPEPYHNKSKATRGEEYLAFIAEKIITEKDLSPTERSVWNRFIEEIQNILTTIFHFEKPFTKEDAESLVKASVQSLFQNHYKAISEDEAGPLFKTGNKRSENLISYLGRAKELNGSKKRLPQKVRTRSDRFVSRFIKGNRAISILLEKFDLRVPDYANVYYGINQKSSRQMGQRNHFEKNYYDPFLQSIAKILDVIVENKNTTRELAYDQIKQYMIARHAPERNEWFRSQGKKGDNFSGMTDQLAASIYETFESQIPQNLINDFWSKSRKCTDKINKYWVDYGKYTQGTIDELQNRNWKYYVPLRGWEPIADEIELDYEYGNTKGDFAGNEKTEGRESMADDPIAYIYQMANSAILWGEKNKAKQTLYNLVRLNGKRTDLFEMAKITYMKDSFGVNTEVVMEQSGIYKDKLGNTRPDHKVFLFNTDNQGNTIKTELGFASMLKDSGYTFSNLITVDPSGKKPYFLRKQHEVEVYLDGSKFKIILKDPAIANAINEDNYSQSINFKYLPIASITRFMSRSVTSWRPAFITSNTYRDFKTGAKTVFIQRGVVDSLKFQAKYGEAAKFLASNLLNDIWENTGKSGNYLIDILNLDPTTEKEKQWKKWYDEYHLNGGPTGHTYLMPLDEVKENIGKHLKKIHTSKSAKIMRLANPINLFKVIEGLGSYGESIARFTAYAMSREKGESIIEAINEAKEITTNFDNRGEYAATIGSFIMFYNATVQGVAKQYNLATNHPLRYFLVNALSLVIQGFIFRWLWDLYNGDDEEKDYAEINKYTMYNNTVIGFKDNYVSIPLSQGFRFWNALGTALYEHQVGRLNTEEMAFDIAESFSQSFSPVEINSLLDKNKNLSIPKTAGTLFSAIGPLMDLAINEDFKNSQIYPEPLLKSHKGKMANSQLYFRYNNALIHSFTDWMYKKGGGDVELGTKTVNGKRITDWLDWNPAKLEYFIKSYTGGPGETVLDAVNFFMLSSLSEVNKQINNNKEKTEGFNFESVPILKTYYHKKYTGFMYEQYKQLANKAEELLFEENRRKISKKDEYEETLTDDQLDFLEDYKNTDIEIKDLLKEKIEASTQYEKEIIEFDILGLRRDFVSKYKYFKKTNPK